MNLGLEGKTALVTGASMGIGKGIARVLAREGVDVAICARHKEGLDAAAEEIRRESGRRVLAIERDGVAIRGESGRCRVGQRDQGTRVFDRQRSKFPGRLGRELDRQTSDQQNCKDCSDAEEETRYEFRG